MTTNGAIPGMKKKTPMQVTFQRTGTAQKVMPDTLSKQNLKNFLPRNTYFYFWTKEQRVNILSAVLENGVNLNTKLY